MKLEIVSANRLTDGRVVYLSHGDRWSEKIIDGRAAKNDEEGAALLAEAGESVAAVKAKVARHPAFRGLPHSLVLMFFCPLSHTFLPALYLCLGLSEACPYSLPSACMCGSDGPRGRGQAPANTRPGRCGQHRNAALGLRQAATPQEA